MCQGLCHKSGFEDRERGEFHHAACEAAASLDSSLDGFKVPVKEVLLQVTNANLVAGCSPSNAHSSSSSWCKLHSA